MESCFEDWPWAASAQEGEEEPPHSRNEEEPVMPWRIGQHMLILQGYAAPAWIHPGTMSTRFWEEIMCAHLGYSAWLVYSHVLQRAFGFGRVRL